ncbi:hypothetical protein ACFE04_009791 [Oxalis oulophora]
MKNFKTSIKTISNLLKYLTNEGLTTEATCFHARLLKLGVSSKHYISVKLLIMYLNSRKLTEANEIIKDFNGFNLIAHNCLISANFKWGNVDEGCKLFDEMPNRNKVSWSAIMSGLMKHGRLNEAMNYFEKNPYQDVVSWTGMISGFVQNGLSFEGLKGFKTMVESGIKPNDVTFISVLKGCLESCDFELAMSVLGVVVKSGFENYVSVSNSLVTLCLRMEEIDLALKVFDKIEEKDVVSWTAILDAYAEIGCLEKARKIFDSMPVRNEISWSAMITRYSQGGYHLEALKLFSEMIHEGFKPNVSCFASILSVLAILEALQTAQNIHAHVLKIATSRDVFVTTSLIDLYCKCGKPEDGRAVFDSALQKNIVTWNSMVSGYSLNGQMEEAKKFFDDMPVRNNVSWNSLISGYVDLKQFEMVFEVFNKMLLSGEIPNQSTFSCVLCACASIASLERGKDAHGKIIKLGIQNDVFVATALTDMYAKSGDIISSKQIFDWMPEKNEISWTVMIQGLAESGFAKESLFLFEQMEKTSNISQNEILLLAVLFACSHCGLVDKGLQYFYSMVPVYGIKPKGKHYTCVVDMLSRSGRLADAEDFINSMPFQPETNAWTALLSGCKTYKNEEIAERVARKLIAVVENNSSGYVLLSNMYASAGKWTDVLNTRKLMQEKSLQKSRGCSWVEVRNRVHSFYSENENRSGSEESYRILEILRCEMMDL